MKKRGKGFLLAWRRRKNEEKLKGERRKRRRRCEVVFSLLSLTFSRRKNKKRGSLWFEEEEGRKGEPAGWMVKSWSSQGSVAGHRPETKIKDSHFLVRFIV